MHQKIYKAIAMGLLTFLNGEVQFTHRTLWFSRVYICHFALAVRDKKKSPPFGELSPPRWITRTNPHFGLCGSSGFASGTTS